MRHRFLAGMLAFFALLILPHQEARACDCTGFLCEAQCHPALIGLKSATNDETARTYREGIVEASTVKDGVTGDAGTGTIGATGIETETTRARTRVQIRTRPLRLPRLPQAGVTMQVAPAARPHKRQPLQRAAPAMIVL